MHRSHHRFFKPIPRGTRGWISRFDVSSHGSYGSKKGNDGSSKSRTHSSSCQKTQFETWTQTHYPVLKRSLLRRKIMKKPSYRLYNLIFPFWLLVGIAPFGGWRGILFIWGSLIIGNFIIDSGVLWLFLGLLKQKDNRTFIWKKSIIRIFLFGFLSDILGSLCGILGIFVLLLIRTYFFPSESMPPKILNVFLFL